ncbi:MAG: thiamine phosphate synthase [Solirubrobacterales bacterium]|nr:thiamine phosphate synthase [Solirubrobacterales bacterium]
MHPDATLQERRERLSSARLYLVCDARPGGGDPEPFLRAALAGGVDIVQLREKNLDECTALGAAEIFRRVCAEYNALFIVNDRPAWARSAGADGVHVGQDDLGVDACRRIAGADRLVGLSTHTPAQVDGAAAAGVDYIGVGPVHATPTKPGRSAVGLALVEHAAGQARLPWFAIGGIGLDEIGSVVDAGAQRVAVVRALTDAEDPQIAAGLLRSVLVEAAAETADV